MGQSKRNFEKTIPVLGKKEYEKEMQFLAFTLEKLNKPNNPPKKK